MEYPTVELAMKVNVIRTKMIGGGNSYDVYVPLSQAPEWLGENGKYRSSCTHIGRDSYKTGRHGYYVDYEHATLPESHFEMPQGWERYDDWLQHKKRANAKMLEIARSVFPELNGVDKWPMFWIAGDNPDAEFVVEVRP